MDVHEDTKTIEGRGREEPNADERRWPQIAADRAGTRDEAGFGATQAPFPNGISCFNLRPSAGIGVHLRSAFLGGLGGLVSIVSSTITMTSTSLDYEHEPRLRLWARLRLGRQATGRPRCFLSLSAYRVAMAGMWPIDSEWAVG